MAPTRKPPIYRTILLAFGLLVVGGVGLAIVMDAGIFEPTPVLRWLEHLSLALRLVIYVVVGVPVGIGIALYFLLELADLLGFLTSPFARLGRRSRRT